jgi:tRNA (guanine-N7-)-methyltransferase
LPKLELNSNNIDDFLTKLVKENKSVSLEVGFGSGENLHNLIYRANEDRCFIGCEPYLNGLASFISKLDAKYYKKIKVFRHDVRELLASFSKEIFDEIFILFPDPWPKLRHQKRRIINKENIDLFLSCLKLDGKIYIATDVEDYFFSIKALFNSLKYLKILNKNKYNLRPENIVSTRYEKKALAYGKRPFYIEVKKILDKNVKVS